MSRRLPRARPFICLALALTGAGLAPATASAAPYAADTILVKLTARHPSRRVTAQTRDAGVVGVVAVIPKLRVRVVRVSGEPAQVADRLSHTPGVRYAEPNWTMHATATPNDPLFAQLGGLSAISAPAGWAAAGLGSFPAGGGVRVGIIDSGIDSGHEDLAGKVAACATSTNGRVSDGACADDNGHGTHVAGTIGAVANNGVGVTGVAFASPLVVCKALGADGSGSLADVAACIRWAHDHGARVISMSLGGPGSRVLADTTKYAWAGGGRAGSLLVAAAGNDSSDAVEFPAGYDDVVSVAATDSADAAAPFSNRNADVEVAAPGVDVLSTRAGGGYVAMSGTSMAAPHAAGVAAVAFSSHPRSNASTIRATLDAATDDLGVPGRDPVYGFGRVNLAKAAG